MGGVKCEIDALRKCLREAVTESCQAYCAKTADDRCHKAEGECFVQEWRKAIAQEAK